MAFSEIYYSEPVLITGHTGFKGSWLSAWLLQQGARLCGYSKDIPTTPSLFQLAALSERMDHRIADVRDADALRATIQTFKPRFVFHLAAQAIVSKSYSGPIDTITTNVNGTANLLEALRHVDWPCVAVIITSDKCYDNVEWVWGYRETDTLGGKDIYSGSKAAAELVFKSYWHSFFKAANGPVRIATARAGNVIGGGDWAADRIVGDCVRAWHAEDRVHIRSPNATRPWQHVLEPLSGYLTLGARLARDGAFDGNSYNFGPAGQQNRTVAQLLEDLGRIWGFDRAEDAYEVIENVPFHEAGLLRLNCDKALLELGWEPNLSYEECVTMTGTWYRNVLRDGRDAGEVMSEQIAQYERLASCRKRVWT